MVNQPIMICCSLKKQYINKVKGGFVSTEDNPKGSRDLMMSASHCEVYWAVAIMPDLSLFLVLGQTSPFTQWLVPPPMPGYCPVLLGSFSLCG